MLFSEVISDHQIVNMSLKVLVISNYDDNYNAVRPEGELFIGLHHAGVEVEVMTFGHAAYVKRFEEEGIKVIPFHPTKKYQAEAVQKIREVLTEGKHDIMHLFNNPAIVNGIRAARNLPVKVVAYRGYAGNIHWWNPLSYRTFLNPRIDKITCLADSVYEQLGAQWTLPKHKLIVVNKGHQLKWYDGIEPLDVRKEFDLPENAFVYTCVANNRRMKGIPYLLEATNYFPKDAPIYILLIGRNMDTPRNLRIIKGTPFEKKVIFTGFRKDAMNIVAGNDASVLSSIFGEAIPKSLIESMALGRPCVATSISGNRGLAVDKKSALVVPPRQSKPLAEAMLRYWQEPELRKQMGTQARAHIGNYFNTERSVREMKKVYEDLLKNT